MSDLHQRNYEAANSRIDRLSLRLDGIEKEMRALISLPARLTEAKPPQPQTKLADCESWNWTLPNHTLAKIHEMPQGIVALARRQLGGREYVHAEPVEAEGVRSWFTDGGSILDSCDSRFSAAVKNGGYPISFHDRKES